MKWPWVSRERYEELDRSANAQIVRLREDAARERDRHAAESKASQDRYDALQARYHQLRLQGHAEPVPAPVIPEPAPVDIIERAIDIASRGMGLMVRDGMFRQAAIDEATGMKKEDIAQRILRGNQPMYDDA